MISFAFGATSLTVRIAASTVGRTVDGSLLRWSASGIAAAVGIGWDSSGYHGLGRQTGKMSNLSGANQRSGCDT